jgi:hypothetical protein
MSDELPPLPPEARALLDAARAVERVPDAKRAEVYARVLHTVAPPGPGGGGPPAGAPASISVTSGPALGVVFAVAATVTVALWSGARNHTTRDSPPAPVRVQRVISAPPAPSPSPLPSTPDASIEALAVTDASVALAVDVSLPRPRSDDFEDDLGAEVALIDEARAALARSDPSAVHRVVRQHRHLRHHRLDAEMDVLEVRAFVLAHDVAGAERAAERFHRRHPHSVLAAQVDDAVRSVR